MVTSPGIPLRIQSLAASDLHFAYGDRPVIEGLSLALKAGELAVMVGPNGCGKSTLLKLLAGAMAPRGGSISIDGKPLRALGRIAAARRMAMVPQMAGTDSAAVLGGAGFSVQQSVLMARYAAHVDDAPGALRGLGGLGIFGFESEEDERLARAAMWDADVHHLAERDIETLSGGERQRVAIARALAQQTPILLLDEPTSALDLFHELELIEQMRAMAAAGRLVLLVTHDLNLAADVASRVLVMDQGRIVADGPPAGVLTPAVLEPVYHVQVRQDAGTLRFSRRPVH
jgi:iron complex transport system ATP-binding protein